MPQAEKLTFEKLERLFDVLERSRRDINSVQGFLTNCHRSYCDGLITDNQYKGLVGDINDLMNTKTL